MEWKENLRKISRETNAYNEKASEPKTESLTAFVQGSKLKGDNDNIIENKHNTPS